jgi:hypothetical protein
MLFQSKTAWVGVQTSTINMTLKCLQHHIVWCNLLLSQFQVPVQLTELRTLMLQREFWKIYRFPSNVPAVVPLHLQHRGTRFSLSAWNQVLCLVSRGCNERGLSSDNEEFSELKILQFRFYNEYKSQNENHRLLCYMTSTSLSERRGRVPITPASYSRGPGLKSRPTDGLSWLGFSLFSSVP